MSLWGRPSCQTLLKALNMAWDFRNIKQLQITSRGEIEIRVTWKYPKNKFTLSFVTCNILLGPFNREGIADLPLLTTLLMIGQKVQEPSLWEVIDSVVFISISSFICFRSYFALITIPLELQLWCKRFILLV